jgi:hypothetical protein
MNWEAIGVAAEVVGAAGVIITLVYVAIQIRHNTASTKSLTHQQLFDSVMEVNCRVGENPEIAALMVKANVDYEAINPADQLRLNMLFINWFTLWHSAFLNHKDGVLDPRGWQVWDKGLKLLLEQQVAVRRTWTQFGHVYDDEFRHYVGKILKQIEQPPKPNASGEH